MEISPNIFAGNAARRRSMDAGAGGRGSLPAQKKKSGAGAPLFGICAKEGYGYLTSTIFLVREILPARSR